MSEQTLYFEAALRRALFLCDPSVISKYDAHAGTLYGGITEGAIGNIAKVLTYSAMEIKTQRGEKVKRLLMNGLMARFKMEALTAKKSFMSRDV